jgi:hypothetical protein
MKHDERGNLRHSILALAAKLQKWVHETKWKHLIYALAGLERLPGVARVHERKKIFGKFMPLKHRFSCCSCQQVSDITFDVPHPGVRHNASNA